MLQRRMLLAAPAIIPLSSLMPLRLTRLPVSRLAAIVCPESLMAISAAPKIIRWVVRIRQANGGESRIVGESTASEVQDLPSLARYLDDKLPWSPFTEGHEISISIMREGESARDLGLI